MNKQLERIFDRRVKQLRKLADYLWEHRNKILDGISNSTTCHGEMFSYYIPTNLASKIDTESNNRTQDLFYDNAFSESKFTKSELVNALLGGYY